MAFRRTYDEILELIRKKLLDTALARKIVRKAGVRPGAGSGGGGSGALFTGGDPWDVITKLSDTDFDVGWRKLGLGPDMQQAWNSGPPCNERVISFTHLRDSALRSGVSNSSRFGYSFDMHTFRTAGLGLFLNRFRHWLEREWSAATVSSLFQQTRVRDVTRNVAKDQARIIAYVTKADFPFTFTLALERHVVFSLTPATYDIPVSGTGRLVSGWYDLPAYDTSVYPPEWGDRPFGDATASVLIKATPPDPAVTIPTTHPQLREGTGPIGLPFLEVEVRTVYYPESSYWIQDGYTPADYRIAQWENEV